MSRGSTPRHAQTAGDLGFAVHFNAETPSHFAQLRVTPFIPRERDNVIKHAIAGYSRLSRSYTSASTDAGAVLSPLLSGGTRVRHGQSARRWWPDMKRLQLPLDDCCRVVLPYNAVHSIQQTEQIPNDPPRMGAKSTTTSNHPSTPAILKRNKREGKEDNF